MNIALIGLGGIILFRIGQYFYERKNSKELEYNVLINNREQYKNLLESREIRTNKNIYDEDLFWEIVTDISGKSKGSYKNFMGLMKDRLNTFSPTELIEIDNLLLSFYETYTTKEIIGASQIIFKLRDSSFTNILINYLISKNQVIFKNTCLQAELIDKLDFEEIIAGTMTDFIGDSYLLKTKKMIPKPELTEDQKKEIKEFYEEENLPSTFPNLWMKYA